MPEKSTLAGVFCAIGLAGSPLLAFGQSHFVSPVDIASINSEDVSKIGQRETVVLSVMQKSLFNYLNRLDLREFSNSDANAIKLFYERRAYHPFWLGKDGELRSARILLEILAKAGEHALPSRRYQPFELAAVVDELDRAGLGEADNLFVSVGAGWIGRSDEAAQVEIDLMKSFLRYGHDVSGGFIEPKSVSRQIHVKPQRVSTGEMLGLLEISSDLQSMLLTLAPQSKEYDELKKEYVRMKRLAAIEKPIARELLRGVKLKLGSKGRRVGLLRSRLTELGDYTPSATATIAGDNIFDEQLDLAVRRFQKRYGLTVDGVAGINTMKMISRSAYDWAAEIAVNLERVRWMNHDLGKRHILVNLPAFEVSLIDNKQVLFKTRAVVGKRQTKLQTPEFSDHMTHLIFNPAWNVPRSIAVNEMLPRLQKDANYLSRRNMRLTNGIDPRTVNWSRYTAETFPYDIRQRPGRSNALGRVKFMFPNQFAIYLHDTPYKSLFNRSRRTYSHGCVRVQNPMRFAELLLSEQELSPQELIDRLLKKRGERQVDLARPVPVHITYRTVWVDGAGTLQMRDDIYGRNRAARKMMLQKGLLIDLDG